MSFPWRSTRVCASRPVSPRFFTYCLISRSSVQQLHTIDLMTAKKKFRPAIWVHKLCSSAKVAQSMTTLPFT